jgi:hypothetical protein
MHFDPFQTSRNIYQKPRPNKIAGVAAERTPELTELI